MPVATVELRGFDKLDAALRNAGATAANMARPAMQASLLLIEADARNLVAQDTRALRNSLHHTIEADPTGLVGRVGPSLKYGQWVEFGRAPGKMPPVDALIGWVRRHGLAGTYSVRTHKRLGSRATQASQDRRVAFLIARKIARRGSKPQPFMQPALDRNRRRITALFAAANANVAAELVRQAR